MDAETEAHKLNALQGHWEHPGAAARDLPDGYAAWDAGVITADGRPTDKGEKLWDRFETHLREGKLTQAERVFWLTGWHGDPQPTADDLLTLARRGKRFDAVNKAAIARYAKGASEYGLPVAWRAVIRRALEESTDAVFCRTVARVADWTLADGLDNPTAVRAWVETHAHRPEADAHALGKWLYAGDPELALAVVEAVGPDCLPWADLPRMMRGWPEAARCRAGRAFLEDAQSLSVGMLGRVLDGCGMSVSEAMLFGPFTDGQLEALRRRDPEGFEVGLWQFGEVAREYAREYVRLFASSDSGIARNVLCDALRDARVL